nr:MAG TPA: tail protein [Caudoviricetes sp.]
MPRDDNNLYYDSIMSENGGISTKPDTTSATRNDVAKDYGFRHPVSGEILFGTAEILPLKKIKLEPGDTVKLDPGFYRDGIEISVTSLADYTYGTATATDIKKNKTAWVRGKRVVGEGYIDQNVIMTASSDDIISGKTAYNSTGDILTGTIEVRDNETIDIMRSYGSTLEDYDREDPNIAPLVKSDNSVSYDLKPGHYRNIKLDIPDLLLSTTARPSDIMIGKKAVSKNRLFTGTYDPDREFTRKITENTNLTAEDFLSTKRAYDKNGNIVNGSMQNVTNINPVEISSTNVSYTIPQGYHDGTGKVNMKLVNKFSDRVGVVNPCTEYDALNGTYFFDDNGDCIGGKLVLANWSPVFLNKTIRGNVRDHNDVPHEYSLSDIPLQNRKITFLKRTERVDNGKEFVLPYSQYNIAESEFGNTVLAIPTQVKEFSNINHYGTDYKDTTALILKDDQYSAQYPAGGGILYGYDYIDRDRFEKPWFSIQLWHQEKDIIIDQIVVKFYNDISKKEDSLKYKITFPYIPYEGTQTVTDKYINRCIGSCNVDYDGIDYENNEKYLLNKIKIYATCSSVSRHEIDVGGRSLLGANFGITFHIQAYGNNMYEKTTEMNTNTYLSQLWDSDSNMYLDISFIGVQIKRYY